MTNEVLARKKILDFELKRITNVLKNNYKPERIIVFGSLVSGKIHSYSDIDLVVIKETKERFLDRLHKVRLMSQPKVGVNFLVYTPTELRQFVKQNHYFVKDEILGKGKLVYEKN